MKTCSKYGLDWPLWKFNKRTDRPGGRNTICSECRAKYRRKYYQENLVEMRASLRKSNDKRHELLQGIANNAKDVPCSVDNRT